MSNYKTILLIIAAAWAGLYGCKPASRSFSIEYNIDKTFFDTVPKLAGFEKINPAMIKIYRAEMIERLVERDAVPEYRLVNAKSDQEYARLADMKNRSYLYLFEVISSAERQFIYMATSYTDGECTGLGPAYLGWLRRDRIRFKQVLRISTVKKKDHKDGLKDTIINNKQINRYQLGLKKDTTHLIFFNDQRFPAAGDTTTPITITQIIRNEPNKIGGKKAVIFTTDKVLEDPKALVFTYYATIQNK